MTLLLAEVVVRIKTYLIPGLYFVAMVSCVCVRAGWRG